MKSLLIDSKVKKCSFEDTMEHFKNTIKYESIRFASYNPSIGLDKEDVEQELRMVLYNCYNDYNDTEIHFSTYLHASVKNHLFNTLRMYQTNKREGIFNEDSLDREVFDESSRTLLEQQPSSSNTESTVIARFIIDTANSVTHNSLEKDIIEYFLDNITVQDIATKHQVSRRTVYNHVNKIRRKLQVLLKEER